MMPEWPLRSRKSREEDGSEGMPWYTGMLAVLETIARVWATLKKRAILPRTHMTSRGTGRGLGACNAGQRL